MSQRFVRCEHCGKEHDVRDFVCPGTGHPIGRSLIGATIDGKYVVHGVLGRGGMGTVFEAEHRALGRQVAVKVLHPKHAVKQNAVRRFHQEARAAGGIGHPNICEVIDLGTLEDGSPYLVMEKLAGETLAERIATEGALSFDLATDALIQVLSGLVAAHHKGIVHRDIKPENVFLTTRVGCPPLVKLLDFGVSKTMVRPLAPPAEQGEGEGEGDLTRIGMVMGTPHYMAPEQARGDRDLDGRVDLYACGVIFYEALTGRRPFSAPDYDGLLVQIISATPRPPSQLRPALPDAFEVVVQKAMAKNREERYATAADFQLDLQSLRDRFVALRSTPPPPLDAAGAPARRVPGATHQLTTEAEVPAVEPSASSIEIPISFGGDTLTSSGESTAASGEVEDEPTRQMVRAPKGPQSTL
jgi:serine/threonine-protein kinase